MNELLKQIIANISKEDTVLVTIIAHTGSTPRSSGAHMLVGRDGRLAGTVGGGAIEAQAIRQAMTQLEGKRSCRLPFDLTGTTSQSLDMVCGGGVELLFSYIGKEDGTWLDAAKNALYCLTELLPGTLILSANTPPVLVRGASDAPFGGLLAGDRFLLPLPLQQRVIVFGGGHVAQALVSVLAGLDFRVTVFENRPEFADPALFPGVQQVILGRYEAVDQQITLRMMIFTSL